jgi:preprotein translocase subunit SecY
MSSELMKRIAFTLGALLVYWLGLRIPLPGIDATVWTAMFDMQSGGMLGQANALSGGGLRTLGILSLAITPYISAAIILQLLSMVSRRLRAFMDDGARGRGTIERYTISAAALLAVLQAYGIAIGLEGIGPVVPEPGLVFRLTTVLTLTAGTLFLVWLAGQITARGIGNGIALIIAAGIVNTLPREIAGLLELSRQGAVAPGTVPAIAVIAALVTALVIVMERARRRLPIAFAERRIGTQTLPAQSTDIALKLNPAGIMPTYLAGLILALVQAGSMFAALFTGSDSWASWLRAALAAGTPLQLIVTAALIVFFTLVYTAFVCDPDRMAARLASCGGTLPGIAPGEATAAHLDRVISRTAMLGAVYLAFVMVLPEFLTAFFGLPFRLGGVTVLVLVCVTLDLWAEVRALKT